MQDLRPYQLEGIDWLGNRPRGILGDEMRLGKTAQIIRAAYEANARSAIVVCPAIATTHWHNQWHEWAPEHDIDLTAVSYEKFVRDPQEYLNRRYDVGVADEFHGARNPEAQRTKLLFGKDGLGWHVDKHFWPVSGTPAVKHAGNLWAVSRAFGAHQMSQNQFERYFCYFGDTGRGWEIKGTRTSKVAEFRKMMEPILLRRKRKDVAPEMPEISFNFLELNGDCPVDLPPEALWWMDHPELATENERIEVALAKIPPLASEIVDSLRLNLYNGTVIFAWHEAVVETMNSVLNAAGVRTRVMYGKTTPTHQERTMDMFADREIQAVVCNILTAGTAIDLSSVSHGYFLELDWLPGNNMQAANRLISMAKDEPVTFDVATWPGSMDDVMQRVLVRRARELNQLL